MFTKPVYCSWLYGIFFSSISGYSTILYLGSVSGIWIFIWDLRSWSGFVSGIWDLDLDYHSGMSGDLDLILIQDNLSGNPTFASPVFCWTWIWFISIFPRLRKCTSQGPCVHIYYIFLIFFRSNQHWGHILALREHKFCWTNIHHHFCAGNQRQKWGTIERIFCQIQTQDYNYKKFCFKTPSSQ